MKKLGTHSLIKEKIALQEQLIAVFHAFNYHITKISFVRTWWYSLEMY